MTRIRYSIIIDESEEADFDNYLRNYPDGTLEIEWTETIKEK